METYILGQTIQPTTSCLSKRMGSKYFETRLAKEQAMLKWKSAPCQKSAVGHILDKIVMKKLLPTLFVISRGKLNKAIRSGFTDFKLKKISITLPNLPPELRGTKIAHISDLHLDLKESFPTAIKRFLKESKKTIDQCKLVVITGDFQDKYLEPTTKSVEGFNKIVMEIGPPIVGVLGNHDKIEIVKQLESLPSNNGIRILLNESIRLKSKHNDASIVLQGIDDPHYYRTHNIKASTASCANILLSHSPEVYKEAERKGINLCLAGHTHAGQIRLPALGAVVKAAKVPKKLLQGTWTYRNLKGHTSPGLGCSGLSIRVLCPPEITVIELK